MSAPSPESFLNLIHRSRRGRLKVYLGYGPGVGKTYQMLLEGQRLKSQGVDVVIGIVETHGRADTASLCLGLPEVPRRVVVYRGVKLEEMDVAAIVARRPEAVLIDELAHTNVPGSANTKRYQDVQEVLAAGIHVITTLNVQHLESLYDTVERLIGVKVKERIPDWVVADADQIVNVDLATEDLRKRLEEGRVYAPERAGPALENFFRKAHLEQLRELTMREIASLIERKGRSGSGREQVQAPDQVVVCISSRSPDPAALLRYGSRLAGRLNRTWYALYVQTPEEDPSRVPEEVRRQLAETLALAHQLGAMVFTFKGEDIAATILRFAREYRIGHVVLGRPGPLSGWQRRALGRRTPVDRLIEEGEGMVIVVVDEVGVPGDEAPRGAAPVVDLESQETGRSTGGSTALARPEAPRRFSQLLTTSTVVIFSEPVGKQELLARLVEAALRQGFPGPQGLRGDRLPPDEVLRRVLRREQEGSMFLAEGIALPHLRVPEIDRALAALGLPHAGLSAESGTGTIEQVFLLLCPDRLPEGCLQLLATASRMFRDAQLRAELRRTREPLRAVELIRAWETAQEAPRP